MGSKNRERRATKQKVRDRRRGHVGGTRTVVDDDGLAAAQWAFGGPRWSPEMVSDVVHALAHRDALETADEWRTALAAPPPADVDNVQRGLELALLHRFDTFLSNGWLPLDLVEHLRRQVPAPLQLLARDAIAVHVSRLARASIHPRWWESVVAAEVRPDRRPAGPSTRAWAAQHGAAPVELLDAVVAILRGLSPASVLPTIVPPPGSDAASRAAREAAASSAGIEARVLARVRALLAKAESTPYPEEADALSGKAQELMNRHALEQAVVEGHDAQERAVITARMWLDPPYVQPKTLLVQAVATANRCRSVALTSTDMVSITGHESDVEAVHILTTSLLVQGGRAMAVEGRTHAGARSRSRSFRQSFLVAFAGRIGERLQEASAHTAGEVEDDRLLPVLAARASAVDEAVDELFGDLTAKAVSASDGAGQAAGRAAADSASLTPARGRVDGPT